MDASTRNRERLHAFFIDSLLKDVQEAQTSATATLQHLRRALRRTQKLEFSKYETILDIWMSWVVEKEGLESAQLLRQSPSLANLPKSPEDMELTSAAGTTASPSESQLSTPPPELVGSEARDSASRLPLPSSTALPRAHSPLPVHTRAATSEETVGKDAENKSNGHGSVERASRAYTAPVVQSKDESDSRAPHASSSPPQKRSCEEAEQTSTAKRHRRQSSSYSKQVLRDIKKNDVSDEWVFECSDLGEGYFILRCTNDTTNKVHKFKHDPLDQQQALKHFTEASISGCHDMPEDFTGRIDEMMASYALRVVDATPEWVIQNNTSLTSAPEFATAPTRPSAEAQPNADLDDAASAILSEDLDHSDTEAGVDHDGDYQDDTNSDEEDEDGFPVVSDILPRPTESIHIDDLDENEGIFYDTKICHYGAVIRCGHKRFYRDPSLYNRVVQHFNSRNATCHEISSQDYSTEQLPDLIKLYGIRVTGITPSQIGLRNLKIEAIGKAKEARKKMRKTKRIKAQRHKVSGGSFRHGGRNTLPGDAETRQVPDADVDAVIGDVQPLLRKEDD